MGQKNPEKQFPVFVSSQTKKLTEYQLLVDFELPWENLSLNEIQSMDLVEIVRKKVVEASNSLHKPVWTEDTGLYLNTWNGLPGPFIKWFLANVGPEGICQMCESYPDRTATAITAIGFCDAQVVRIFQGETKGIIPLKPRGSLGFGWDSIFQPESENETFAEMTRERKNMISMRARAFRQFFAFLKDGGYIG
jgi:non-canonical purine NTP pyrophosphatase (RdgB/HAM1 family)